MPDVAKALWTPTGESIAHSRMNRFTQLVNESGDLHAWSIDQPEQFWSLVWDDCGVVGQKGELSFLAAKPGSPMSTAQFFPDARISVVENMLATTGSHDALVAIDEAGNRRTR